MVGYYGNLFGWHLGTVRGIVGEGMPLYKNVFHKGNLYIKFDVDFPEPHFMADAAKYKVNTHQNNDEEDEWLFLYNICFSSVVKSHHYMEMQVGT